MDRWLKLLVLALAGFTIAAPAWAQAQTAPPTMPPAAGSVSGTLGYPSDAIPPLIVYAFRSDDYTKFQKTETAANQTSFTITGLTPGSYVVVAYPKEGSGLEGGFTKAVACGLLATCTDHSLVKVMVEAGKTTAGVEVKDWYAPDNAFPVKPR